MAGAPQSIVASVGNAFANNEGYGASAGNKPTRTNNPGDIGNTDNGGTQNYATQDDGYNALYGQVNTFFTGTTPSGSASKLYNPDQTIAQTAAIYAKDPTYGAKIANQLGVPPNTKWSDIASGAVPIKSVPQPQGDGHVNDSTTTSGGSAPNQVPNYGVDDTDPATAVPVFGQEITSQAVIDATNPALIISSGLDQAAWYNDPQILQVNGPTAAVGSPIQFLIYFKENDALLPISLRLNASVRTFQKSLRHIVNKQQTRTGVLVNLWGMSPDTITGAASTGLMANQLGITDFLSLSTASDGIKQSVLQAFQSSGADINALQTDMNAEGFFRVAAKDAFVEFLAMFKNNGNVWFQNKNYTGVTTSMQQVDQFAWSPITGSSTFQNVSRRNDVMTRGRVVMIFRNAKYSGYFKSLGWTMDAKNPFRWNFNFVFQVEGTSMNVEVPV